MAQGKVFVLGAGPAGLFAARKIATAGYQVAIFNRDVRPGGLAEYGIYPTKLHMKNGLRKQFAKILSMPNVAYFGNVPIRTDGALSLQALQAWNPAAIVVAAGAQGNKKLGIEGEESLGVYSAKDFVYHYNRLPPFATADFSTGRRVAIVGMGNVMVDVAHWLTTDEPGEKPAEVTVIARRGPFEVKFDKKEFDDIEAFLDRRAFREEVARVAEVVRAAGQDVSQLAETVFPWLKNEPAETLKPRLTFRFLASPVAIEADSTKRIARLRVMNNILVREGDATRPKASGQESSLDFDTLIFAIGDVADPSLGLPYAKNCYVTNNDHAEPDRAGYEVYDPASKTVLEGVYVVGWARKASEGLVGKARFDAEHGCDHILKFLERAEKKVSPSPREILESLRRINSSTVTAEDVNHLLEAEAQKAQALGVPEFRYATNQEMLHAMFDASAVRS
jgi:ferredoxin/flavodoxin---NADP+ reductase